MAAELLSLEDVLSEIAPDITNTWKSSAPNGGPLDALIQESGMRFAKS